MAICRRPARAPLPNIDIQVQMPIGLGEALELRLRCSGAAQYLVQDAQRSVLTLTSSRLGCKECVQTWTQICTDNVARATLRMDRRLQLGDRTLCTRPTPDARSIRVKEVRGPFADGDYPSSSEQYSLERTAGIPAAHDATGTYDNSDAPTAYKPAAERARASVPAYAHGASPVPPRKRLSGCDDDCVSDLVRQRALLPAPSLTLPIVSRQLTSTDSFRIIPSKTSFSVPEGLTAPAPKRLRPADQRDEQRPYREDTTLPPIKCPFSLAIESDGPRGARRFHHPAETFTMLLEERDGRQDYCKFPRESLGRPPSSPVSASTCCSSTCSLSYYTSQMHFALPRTAQIRRALAEGSLSTTSTSTARTPLSDSMAVLRSHVPVRVLGPCAHATDTEAPYNAPARGSDCTVREDPRGHRGVYAVRSQQRLPIDSVVSRVPTPSIPYGSGYDSSSVDNNNDPPIRRSPPLPPQRRSPLQTQSQRCSSHDGMGAPLCQTPPLRDTAPRHHEEAKIRARTAAGSPWDRRPEATVNHRSLPPQREDLGHPPRAEEQKDDPSVVPRSSDHATPFRLLGRAEGAASPSGQEWNNNYGDDVVPTAMTRRPSLCRAGGRYVSDPRPARPWSNDSATAPNAITRHGWRRREMPDASSSSDDGSPRHVTFTAPLHIQKSLRAADPRPSSLKRSRSGRRRPKRRSASCHISASPSEVVHDDMGSTPHSSAAPAAPLTTSWSASYRNSYRPPEKAQRYPPSRERPSRHHQRNCHPDDAVAEVQEENDVAICPCLPQLDLSDCTKGASSREYWAQLFVWFMLGSLLLGSVISILVVFFTYVVSSSDSPGPEALEDTGIDVDFFNSGFSGNRDNSLLFNSDV